MARCHSCGNDYERTFEVMKAGRSYTFDCFECAIHVLAPECAHCGVKILGHGVQANQEMFCCAHCARHSGVRGTIDHVGQGAPA